MSAGLYDDGDIDVRNASVVTSPNVAPPTHDHKCRAERAFTLLRCRSVNPVGSEGA